MNFQPEYLGKFEDERERLIRKLARQYHEETEAFDRTVCTGPIVRGSIRPMNGYEYKLVNQNAIRVRERILQEALTLQISPARLFAAILNEAQNP